MQIQVTRGFLMHSRTKGFQFLKTPAFSLPSRSRCLKLAEEEEVARENWRRRPEAERPNTVSKFFQVVEDAVSAEYGSTLLMWAYGTPLSALLTTTAGDVVPAASSSIEGLEKVRLDSLDFATRSSPCPICLEDFEEPSGGVDQPLPCLPCLHHFHLHCIIPWLEKNHLCAATQCQLIS